MLEPEYKLSRQIKAAEVVDLRIASGLNPGTIHEAKHFLSSKYTIFDRVVRSQDRNLAVGLGRLTFDVHPLRHYADIMVHRAHVETSIGRDLAELVLDKAMRCGIAELDISLSPGLKDLSEVFASVGYSYEENRRFVLKTD